VTSSVPAQAVIPARSERQAMDWSLVLASQSIEVALDRAADGIGWQLIVAEADEDRARAAIVKFRAENRGFGWRHELAGSGLVFHWGVIFWVFALGFFFAAQESLLRGLFDTRQVHAGEWWRAFTAVWLHRDAAHLASNAAIGAVLMGLAMARYGVGLAVLGAYLAGALANYGGLLLRPEPYVGLGASGMVMGALGMLAAQAFPLWRAGRLGARVVLVSLGTGALLFILLGVDPKSDVLAHAGGFVAGVVLGAGATLLPERALPAVNRLALGAFVMLTLATWFLALR
jgi:rhomboid protease GluP